MASDKEIKTLITADVSPFEDGMKKVEAASKAAFASINSGAGSLAKPFEIVQQHLLGLTALLAGGAAFKEAISTTREWGGEQAKLAKQLQITTEQAAAYQIAAEEIGVTGDQLVTASDKLTKQMVNNAGAFQKLGIATLDSNGSLRSTGDVLPEVIEHLQGIKNVTEQNAQGIALFGKGWTEVRGILKLSKEALDEAAQKAKDLNLVVDPKQLKAYKAAMSDVHLISTSLQVQVGNMLLPILTQLGSWMGETGPYVVGAFSVVLKTVGEVVAFVYRAIVALVEIFAGLAQVLVAFIQGDYKGAWNLAVDAADQSADKIKKIFTGVGDVFESKVKVSKVDKGDDAHVDLTKEKGEKADKSRVPQWDAELAEFKLHQQEMALEEGRFYEMSKSDEKAFWDQKLTLTTSGTTENAAVRKKDAELGLALQKDAFDLQLQSLKAQADAYKNSYDQRIAITEQEAAIIGQKFGIESKEYAAVQGEIIKLKRAANAQIVELESAKQDGMRQLRMGEIDFDEAAANERYALGLLTNSQLLELEKQFEVARSKIAEDAQLAKIAAMQSDPDHSPVALQKEKDQLLVIEQKNALAIAKISTSMRLQQTANARDYINSLEQNFGTVFTQLLARQTTFAQASKSLMSGLANSSAQFATKMLQDQIQKWVQQSTIYKAVMGGNLATTETSADATVAVKAEEADGVVVANASEAASGAAASVASTPYVGWALGSCSFRRRPGHGARGQGRGQVRRGWLRRAAGHQSDGADPLGRDGAARSACQRHSIPGRRGQWGRRWRYAPARARRRCRLGQAPVHGQRGSLGERPERARPQLQSSAMSDAVYPILPGLAWGVMKSPEWSSSVQESTSGREYSLGHRIYPKWAFRLTYEFLRQYGSYAEQQTLVGFVNARRGRADSWLYRDPTDFQVFQQGLGVGDGVTRIFPLVRSYGGFVEPVIACDNITQVRADGVPLNYGTAPGQWTGDAAAPRAQNVVLGSAPAPGVVIDWSGTYFYRCRFSSDLMTFKQSDSGIWEPGSIDFRSVPA